MIGLNRSLARSMMAAFVSLASLVTQVQAGGVPPTVTAIDPAPPAVTNGSSINVIRVSFSEPVTAGAADVELRDLSNAPIPFQATYDDINDQLVIDLDTPVENGYVTVILHDSIQNLAGIPLDGETDQALAPTFPTGNGLPGGVMAVRLVEFSGDVTLDGSVDFADLEELLDSWAQPNPLADFDGNGFVDFTDLNTLLDRWGSTLPTDDGADPTIMEMTPGSEDVLTGPPATVTIVFSEVMDGSTIDTRSLFLLDDSGVRLDPGSVQVNGATVVWDFNAMPVRGVSCDSYTVHISNGMADPSGRPLLRDLTPPLLSAQLLPDPPVVSHGLGNGITTDLVVTVSVETVNAEMLEISGPDGMMTVPVTMSPMTVDLDLHENRANQFVFTAISTCGDRSTPTAIEIINDRQAPELYVDFPVISDGEGTVVYADATDLQGRIGDLLSGFEGLDVHVTSDAGLDMDAAVNVGIGTNGTWFISGAQLLNDRKTNFVVTATDVAGNQARIDFGVRKGMVDTTRARFVIPSDGGNNQSAQIHRPLTAPIKVQVLRGDGTPFVNKLVTFTVTKSDGLVMSPSAVRGGPTPARMRQVRTDSNGFATVFWILGGDAGMGNNRVTVSSLDIQGTAVFCASALPGDPYQINIGSGNNQVGEIGSTLPMPLRAFVSDSCNGVGGVPVTFEVIRGNGLVNGASSATVNTTMTGHAQVSFKLGTTVGTNVIRADYPGNPNGPADFVVRGVRRGSGPTTFAGVVHNNASQPIEGALCALQVSGSVVGFDFTDADGRFVITGLPSGPARLHVSGASATAVGGMAVSPGSFPALYFEVILVTGIENSLPSPVLLPALNSNNAVPYSLTQDTILTVEGMEGLRMIIKPGSMYMRQGGPLAPAGTPVSLNQVHHDDIPMPMPNGAAPPFSWTL
ncbi:MAG: hypothetical protein KDA21_09705, partial [Phycisphaerales bacterium]|nr:hypothetical protein [Phycisphaerales bacterium]